MARPRQFVEEEVLDKAMMCFWKNGYEGSSLTDLENATGVGRISLYNTFKDKENLFIAAQNKYHQNSQDYMIELFTRESANLSDLIHFVEDIGKQPEGESPREFGCMMVNAALDVNSIGDKALANVKTYRAMITGLYEEFLKKLQNRQEIKADLNVKAAAAFIVGVLWGAVAVNRLYRDPTEAALQLEIVLKTIANWRVEG